MAVQMLADEEKGKSAEWSGVFCVKFIVLDLGTKIFVFGPAVFCGTGFGSRTRQQQVDGLASVWGAAADRALSPLVHHEHSCWMCYRSIAGHVQVAHIPAHVKSAAFQCFRSMILQIGGLLAGNLTVSNPPARGSLAAVTSAAHIYGRQRDLSKVER